MRIVFLDVDGVLNWRGTWKHSWYGETQKGVCCLEPSCCELFLSLCDELDLTIVLSSTWRKSHITRVYLEDRGILKREHPIDPNTPSASIRGNLRGYEIDDWLVQHPEIDPFKGYVILDDNSDMLPHQMKRFVQTSWNYGDFMKKYAQRVRELFK